MPVGPVRNCTIFEVVDSAMLINPILFADNGAVVDSSWELVHFPADARKAIRSPVQSMVQSNGEAHCSVVPRIRSNSPHKHSTPSYSSARSEALLPASHWWTTPEM